MRVSVNRVYTYRPNLMDRVDARTVLQSGERVKVINLPGAPKANTMGQCYVADPGTGEFIGMVSTSSLFAE